MTIQQPASGLAHHSATDATGTLLAHVVSRFAPRQWENVATEALRYLLSRPSGTAAVTNLLAPLGFDPGHLTWRAQAAALDDTSIPDLVGDDRQGRPALVIEGKFWAALTDNQPLGYLARQRAQFPGALTRHLLLFLVPHTRVDLITAELEARLEHRHTKVGSFPLIESPAGRVAVVSWAHMLAHFQTALEETRDRAGLDDLAQLRGLCDRADAEALVPIAAEEVGADRGRRFFDYCDLVDQATNVLVAGGEFDTKQLRSTAGKGWYGRYIRTRNGHVLLFGVMAYSWGHRYPTPWWVRLWQPTPEARQRYGS